MHTSPENICLKWTLLLKFAINLQQSHGFLSKIVRSTTAKIFVSSSFVRYQLDLDCFNVPVESSLYLQLYYQWIG